MVLIVKKLVPVFTYKDNVPKQWLNLRKAVHVTSFKHLYPNIPKILVRKYDLKPDDKIVVFWMKEVPTRRFQRYRLPFRKVYSGLVKHLSEHLERIIRK